MPLVIKEDGVAVHIYHLDNEGVIHCFDGDIESEIEVEIEISDLLVAGYGPGNKLPTGEFLLRALLVVHKHHDHLHQSWEEIQE